MKLTVSIVVTLVLLEAFLPLPGTSSSTSSRRSKKRPKTSSTSIEKSGSHATDTEKPDSKTISSGSNSHPSGSSASGFQPEQSGTTGSKKIGTGKTGSKLRKGLGTATAIKPNLPRRHCVRNLDCLHQTRGLSGVCRAGLCFENKGRTCYTNVDCGSSFIPLGGTGRCDSGHCSCVAGYIETPQGCREFTGDTGSGTKHSATGGSIGVTPGRECTRDGQCPAGDTAYSGRCLSQSKCECSPGYHAAGHRCVTDASSVLVGSWLVVLAAILLTRLSWQPLN